MKCDTLIRRASVIDGTGAAPEVLDVAVSGDCVAAMGPSLNLDADRVVDAEGLALAPGFIDTHTHADLALLRDPAMLASVSQGVTTVITGNCGISGAPVELRGEPVDPMNLLGRRAEFRYPTFHAYVEAVKTAKPSVNVAALVGHTSLRNNQMDRLDRTATAPEVAAMCAQLREALDAGALGLSTGLAYHSAASADTDEVIALAQPLAEVGGIYATHLRSEASRILDALNEAFAVGRAHHVPVIVSHLKCAGVDNWGRSAEVLSAIDKARAGQPVGWDCYPYAASSSTLDLKQVDERVVITITWSEPFPAMAGRTLAQIAGDWHVPQYEAARRLQPAGAIYHCMADEDVKRVLSHPATMIGSDGLPNDPRPHPRLWGTFPRVLGKYSREEGLFSMSTAIYKMTGMPARRFGLSRRGLIREGYFADLVLFDPETILDAATFAEPARPAIGIHAVWVNGERSFSPGEVIPGRNGRFLSRDYRVPLSGAPTDY